MDEGVATLALGKAEYPATSSVCPHTDDYLDILIPPTNANENDTHEHLDWRGLRRSSSTPRRRQEADDTPRERMTNTLLLSIAKGIVLGCIYLNQKGVSAGGQAGSAGFWLACGEPGLIGASVLVSGT